MSESGESGIEGSKRGARCPNGVISSCLGLLRRAFQGQKVRIPKTIRQLCDGEHFIQSFVPRSVTCLQFNSQRANWVVLTAEFHSQTAIEAAKKIHADLKEKGKSAEDIDSIVCRTHEACIRIIDKQHKPMDNFADRDHCVQYMVATMLVFNRLEATDYTDGGEAATSPLVESLRQRITCKEDPEFTRAYHDPNMRTIPNALTVTLKDGTVLEETVVEAPLGHKLRREEAKPEILEKFERHLGPHFPEGKVQELVKLGQDKEGLENMSVDEYMDKYVKD